MKFLKKPIVPIILLLVAAFCLVASALMPESDFRHEDGVIKYENPESFATSEDGFKAIVDDGARLYCVDEDNSFVYGIEAGQLPYENAKIVNVLFGADNELYCHVAVYDAQYNLINAESVWKIDSKGQIKREILHYDYEDSDEGVGHHVRISGLHFQEEKLCYLYKKDGGSSIVMTDPDDEQDSLKVFVSNKKDSEIVKCYGTDEGDFLIIKNNGELGRLSCEGKYKAFYKAKYDIKKDGGVFVRDAYVTKDGLYMLAGQGEIELLKWVDGDWEKLLKVEEAVSLPEEESIYSEGLGEYEGKLAVHLNDSIYVLEDNALVKCADDIELPLSVTVWETLRSILLIIGVPCLAVGTVFGIGNLMKWRFSLLSKQLFSTIPMVFIMLVVVITIMFSSMINLSSEDIVKETIAVTEIAAAQFDGKELEKITGYESVNDGSVKALNEKLAKFVEGNTKDWSRNYNLAIYVRTQGEKFTCVATSDGSNQFMISDFSTETPIHDSFYENSHTFAADVSYGEDSKNLHLVLISPIYREDGSYDAVMLLNASQDRLTEELVAAGWSLLFNILFWGALLILVISLVAARNVKALRKAKNVVAQIAGGDFSVRVDKFTKDEVGEICVGVNDMAGKLEEYFEERIRNEQFYYKFVPKKFRVLLHKEKFTDLALGDAQSVDLSILFCDIRAFSMNSEMMTAKESFEFVNRIYGKAGPIIRKHNGFIDKYIGDAVMALFESAQDAVEAGIELYKAIVLSENPEEDFGLPSVKVGVGIHSGMARIGIVGEEERMSGTVIADTVNLSSRIESLTKRYGAGMIISKDTLDRMEEPDKFSTRYLGMVQVAGVNEVATLYEVMDCLDEEPRLMKEESKMAFREAVRLYHTGELKQALDALKKLEEENKDDKAVSLYAQYIENKIESSDTEHNIFKFVNK